MMLGLWVMRMVLAPRRGAQHLTKGLAPALVFVRRHNEAALGEVSRLLDVFEASQYRCLVSPVVFAGIDLADGNAGETKTSPKCLRERLAVVVEIALGGDVVKIKRIGIGLIGEGGAVADDDNKPSAAQRRRKIVLLGEGDAGRTGAEHCGQAAGDGER